METYIALLRGINVGGRNKLPMAALRDALEEGIGLLGVRTYIQSGNLVFQHPTGSTAASAREITQLIETRFSLQVPTLVFEAEWLETILREHPFQGRSAVPENQRHITFWGERPEPDKLAALLDYRYPPDELKAGKNALYLYAPTGYGRTKFHNGFLEKKLGVPCTTRNWKTSHKLLEMAGKFEA